MPVEVDDRVHALAFDGRGCLVRDLLCIKCGYNLRTLHRDAACPECGTAVGRSIEGNRLRYCDPWWLKQVWEGLNCFGLAAVAAGGAVVAGAFVGGLPDGLLVVLAAPLAAMIGLGVYGFFKATRPDPARIDREHLMSPRRVARVAWAGALALFVALMVVQATAGPRLAAFWTSAWLPLSGLLLLYAGPVFLLVHAAMLAARLPDVPLVLAVVAVDAWLVLLGLASGAVMLTPLWDSLAWVFGADVWSWRWGLEEVVGYGWLSAAAMLAALLVWYWWALTRAARFAWATWAGGKGGGS